MYIPSTFRAPSSDVARELIAHHPFATLTAIVDGEIACAHVPLVVKQRAPDPLVLIGHLARANPFVRALDGVIRVHAQCMGPHAYVSASFYERPTEQVPTWNYAVVVATGVARVVDPLPALGALVDVMERGDGAWRMDALDDDFVRELSRAIVAFELTCDVVDAKLKLSQNRSATDRQRVRDALAARAHGQDAGVVELMDRIVLADGERDR